VVQINWQATAGPRTGEKDGGFGEIFIGATIDTLTRAIVGAVPARLPLRYDWGVP
jgi:hypothetical protein